MAFDVERARVERHLAGAEVLAKRGPARQRDWGKRLVRTLLLEELAVYRRGGRFPKNQDFRGKCVPYFVDEAGTRCAMAHLLEVGGYHEVVQRVASRRNHARVHELANEGDLVDFLRLTGLTLEEAARIQPSYCFLRPADCYCNAARADRAIVEGVVLPGASSSHGRIGVVAVYGSSTIQVGDESEAELTGTMAGGAAWFESTPSNNGASLRELPYRVSDEGLTCYGSGSFSSTRVLPRDVAYQALSSDDRDACYALLSAEDPLWSRSVCDSSEVGCGCRFHSAQAARDEPALATLSILVAILGYRRRRRSGV